MLGKVTPVKRVGNYLVRPNWRYDALFNPPKYKLKEFVKKTVPNNARSLRRFIGLGLPYEVHKIPQRLKNCYTSLTEENKPLFLAMWNRYSKRNHMKPIEVDADPAVIQKIVLWDLKKVHNIDDLFFQSLIKHHSNFEYNQHIAYALELARNKDYLEIFKFIGYCIYAKIKDEAIAIRWNIPVKHVEALRLIFYDFSNFPKDRLAALTYLRQLTNSGLFTDIDFAYYRRVFELGELGLKAQTDFYNLTAEEKKLIEEYLGKSIISTTLNLNFSIKNQKDAVQYGVVVSNLASYNIKTSETSYLDAKIRNLNANTKRIEGEMNAGDVRMSDNDIELLSLLSEHSLHDSRPEMKTLDMLL